MSAMWPNGAMGGLTVQWYNQGGEWRPASDMAIKVQNVEKISVVIPAAHLRQ